MLKNIKLNNFKSHKSTNIEIGNLTLICGANGVGKSSLIQILLLLREAYIKDRTLKYLDLKSNPIRIGTVSDAIYEYSEYDGFEVELDFTESLTCDFVYEAESQDDFTKSFINLNIDKVNNKNFIEDDFDELNKLSLFNTNFQYISAARLGPLDRYEKDDKIVDIHKQISVKEGKAEYFVHFLEKYKDIDVIEELCINNEGETFLNDLYSQVILWEKYIFNGANAEVNNLGKLGFELKYSFDSKRNTTKKTKSYDAKNVGYGLSYTLPILVAILSAKKGALIIIENPEAHLHPSGISKLTELLCIAANAGIQIITETHSDHVINGILVQTINNTKKVKKGINKDLVRIHQFYRDNDEDCTGVESIKILENGRLNSKPPEFFDQIESDLTQILGF